MVDTTLEACLRRIRDHLRGPLASSRIALTKNAENTENIADPARTAWAIRAKLWRSKWC